MRCSSLSQSSDKVEGRVLISPARYGVSPGSHTCGGGSMPLWLCMYDFMNSGSAAMYSWGPTAFAAAVARMVSITLSFSVSVARGQRNDWKRSSGLRRGVSLPGPRPAAVHLARARDQLFVPPAEHGRDRGLVFPGAGQGLDAKGAPGEQLALPFLEGLA